MRTKPTLAFVILHSAFSLSAHAQGTLFTYQGRLTDNGTLASGNYDLRLLVFDVPTGGLAIASTMVPGI